LKNRYSTEANAPSIRIKKPAVVAALNGNSVHDCMRQRFASLTALEERVISLILSQCNIDETTLLKVVADETHVSKAMLVKIAKKLGFDGFVSLRTALSEHNRRPLMKVRRELDGPPTVHTLAEKAREASLNALENIFSLISFEGLERAAQWLCAAHQRDFYGLGGSAQVARDAACKFLRIGVRASTFEDGAMMLMSASLLQGRRRRGLFVFWADFGNIGGRPPGSQKRGLCNSHHQYPELEPDPRGPHLAMRDSGGLAVNRGARGRSRCPANPSGYLIHGRRPKRSDRNRGQP
jgi:Helix-turn-helix domain, rpiR family